MIRKNALLVCLVLVAISFSGMKVTEGGGEEASRGSFATHDAGNFTINIGDDGGATGWDTLEFPPGSDRLSSAYFGIGTASDSVDFGDHNEFRTNEVLSITSPGSWTDEAGYCSFSGWPGEDFEDVNITQRTFVNRYQENTQGHSGRWMVVDYEIDMTVPAGDHVYFLQTMNVDLGTSSSDDQFSFLSDINMTVISEGTTFVGLGSFSLFENSYFNGHNAGAYGPGVYSGESDVWDQMFSPNDQSSSATGQDWYMDISMKVPSSEFSESVHVPFIVTIGSSLFGIRNAYHDAVNAMTGNWTGPDIAGWRKGEVNLTFDYNGPIFPPSETLLMLSSREMEGDWGDHGLQHPIFIPGTTSAFLEVNTSTFISDWGEVEWYLFSRSRFGFFDEDAFGSFDVDNKGPNTTIVCINNDPTGILKISLLSDDRGGSGVKSRYLSLDGEYFIKASSLELYDDRDDFQFHSYAEDNAGNEGPISSVFNVINDGTPPEFLSVTTSPLRIDEDHQGPVNITFTAKDEVSGLNLSTARMRWGLDSPTSEWMAMSHIDGKFRGEVETDWDAAQGRNLSVILQISDRLGNVEEWTTNFLINPEQDPPHFRIQLTAQEWESNKVGIFLNGSDPDGDDLTFELYYAILEGQSGFIDYDPIPQDLLEVIDDFHYLFTVPDIEYEGYIGLLAEIDDGNKPSQSTATFRMDRKAPVLGVSNIHAADWITEPVTMTINATDGGSGVLSIWFVRERNGNDQLITSSEILLKEEGIYNISIFAQDVSGNVRELEIGPIKIDLNAPVIGDPIGLEEDPLPGDDIEFTIPIDDTLGFDRSKVAQDPSLFIECSIYIDGFKKEADAIIPTLDGMFKVTFMNPFMETSSVFTVIVQAKDMAGNIRLRTLGPYELEGPEPADEPPFLLQYPEEVTVGEDYTITITHDGPVILEVWYPDVLDSWIITPDRTSGEERNFKLPGPFLNEDILFIIHFGPKDSKEANMTYPTGAPIPISVVGWTDTDEDMMCDAFEMRYGLPHDSYDGYGSDRDKDGLNILEEMANLTDPEMKDSDNDGMDDGWEAEMGTLPFREDRYDDPDDDSWSNIKEHEGDTDPRDPLSHPEDPPATPWYWIVLIVAVMLGIIGYFVFQMFNRRKLEDELDEMDDEMTWDTVKKDTK